MSHTPPADPSFQGKQRPPTTDWARPSKRRAVIVGGARTPFVRAFAEFLELDSIALSVAAIGTTTALLSALGLAAGRRFGDALGKRLDALGGLVLIGLGVKALVEHLRR